MSNRVAPVLLVLALVSPAAAQVMHPKTPPATNAGIAAAPRAPVKVTTVEGITEYRLDNGLKVLLYPDASKPTVTVNVTYFVGSRHEGYGESGMAHLLEHMVFRGTPTHPDVWKALQEHGAKFNGTTWFDRTNYYEELPATPENLEFALRLEADRMVNSKIAAEDLAKEFSVVRNEFEMGENNPAGVLEEKMMATAYQWHNYGKTTIGSRSDIERVPVDNLRAFYRRWYQPDNAMLVVAGKFDEKQALALIQRYFAPLPRPARKLPETWTEEPVQDGERTVILRRTGDVALVSLMYHGVAGADPDAVPADALIDILTNKPAGRLYKALVEKGLASEVYGYSYSLAEPGVMQLTAKVRAGGSPDKVRDVMLQVVEGVGATKIAPEELERWRARSLKELELALTETSKIGVLLSDVAAAGDWRLLFVWRDRIKAATVDDVARVARAFLKQSNRTLGMFLPTKSPDRSPAPRRPDVVAMLKDWKPSEAPSEGEAFAATPDELDRRARRETLPSGTKLALLPKKTKGRAVRLVLTVRYGSEKELQAVNPAADDLLPQMLLRGTKKRSFQQVRDELDRLRAEVSCSSAGGRGGVPNPGVAQCRVKTVRESLPAVLALVGELLREPAFDRGEFERLKRESLANLEEQLQDPNANGFVSLSARIFPFPKKDVRHVPTIKESLEDLKRLQVGDLARLHRATWGGSFTQVAVVGDFDEAELKQKLGAVIASWKSPRPYVRVERPFKEGVPGEEAIDTPDKEMAFVGVGHPLALRDDNPDYPALVMLNHLLGGSASSRLLDRLRQKEGLSYGAFSGIHAHPIDASGFFYAGAICAPQNADRAMALMLEEIERIRKEGVAEQELAAGKRSYAQSFAARLAEDDFVAGELAQGLFLGRTFAWWRDLNSRIDRLAAADVTAAARKYLLVDKLAKVKAGDLSKKKS